MLPLQIGRAARDARDNLRVSAYKAERLGPSGRGFRVGIVDDMAAVVPPHDTFYIEARGPGSAALRFWAYDWLLPRLAVTSPADADWVLVWHSDPRRVGVRFSSLRPLGPRTWLGRVGR